MSTVGDADTRDFYDQDDELEKNYEKKSCNTVR